MKLYPIFGSASGIIVAGLVFQQTGINISTELLISILVNVAIIALAFGRIQANVGHIKETMSRIENALDEDVERVEKRVEQVAGRYHKLANDLLGQKLLREIREEEERERDQG